MFHFYLYYALVRIDWVVSLGTSHLSDILCYCVTYSSRSKYNLKVMESLKQTITSYRIKMKEMGSLACRVALEFSCSFFFPLSVGALLHNHLCLLVFSSTCLCLKLEC